MSDTRTQDDTAITLLPQEQEGACKFSGRFVATRNAVERFGDGVTLTALELVRKQVALRGGMDYLQVLKVGGERLWIIDDVSVVTALLAEDC